MFEACQSHVKHGQRIRVASGLGPDRSIAVACEFRMAVQVVTKSLCHNLRLGIDFGVVGQGCAKQIFDQGKMCASQYHRSQRATNGARQSRLRSVSRFLLFRLLLGRLNTSQFSPNSAAACA